MSISDLIGQPEPPEKDPKPPETSPVLSNAPTPTLDKPVVEAPKDVPNDPPVEDAAPASVDEITAALLSRISDIGDKANFKILIYGDPGCTKSSWLGGAANNLVYDMEDGLISMKSSPTKIKPNVKGIPFKSFVQANLLVDRLASRHEAFDSWEVFSVDTISDLHKKLMQEHLKIQNGKRPSKSLYTPETEDYIEVNEMLAQFVRSLRDLDRNVIITAHAKTVEPKNKPAKTYPDFSESLANKIEGFMDIVAYVEMREIEGQGVLPVFRVQSDGTVHAKNRLGLVGEFINPSYDDFVRRWSEVNGNTQ